MHLRCCGRSPAQHVGLDVVLYGGITCLIHSSEGCDVKCDPSPSPSHDTGKKVDSRRYNKLGAKFSKAPRMGKPTSSEDVVSPSVAPPLHTMIFSSLLKRLIWLVPRPQAKYIIRVGRGRPCFLHLGIVRFWRDVPKHARPLAMRPTP